MLKEVREGLNRLDGTPKTRLSNLRSETKRRPPRRPTLLAGHFEGIMLDANKLDFLRPKNIRAERPVLIRGGLSLSKESRRVLAEHAKEN